jgi:hypothetical protein
MLRLFLCDTYTNIEALFKYRMTVASCRQLSISYIHSVWHATALLVEAQSYKPEGRGFKFR